MCQTFIDNIDFDDVRKLLLNVIFSAVKEAVAGDAESMEYLESQDIKDICESIGFDYKLIAPLKRYVRYVRGHNRTKSLDEIMLFNDKRILAQIGRLRKKWLKEY